jgi:TolB-like protein/Flp pilus assembly protein TadD
MPFANLSADPANEYLADGIAETMITMLAQVPQLLVIGKNSSFSYKGQDTDPHTIGQQLGVGALLEGSVQRAGDRLRVAVQLVNTRDGGHLWAETYDRPTADVFAVQDEIAKRVTEALSIALAGKSGPGSIGTTNVAAYDAYLRGKQLTARRETKALEEAIALLEKAVAKDPAFARAWVELSRAYSIASRSTYSMSIGRMPPEQAKALSESAARRAVDAGPGLGAAHAVLALALHGRDEAGAASQFERAIELSPDDPVVIRAYAVFLTDAGHPKEALKLFEPLLAREPKDAAIRVAYARALDGSGDVRGALGRLREAMRLEPLSVFPYQMAAVITDRMVGSGDLSLRLWRRAASLDPDSLLTRENLALSYFYIDESERAAYEEQELRRLGATLELRRLHADAAVHDGHPNRAREILEQLFADSPQDFESLIGLSRLRGSTEEYRETLRRINEFAAANESVRQFDNVFADALVCLNAWTGDDRAARGALARWEPVWRSRHAYGYLLYLARVEFLARSLACVGRNDDALTELEALVSEGYDLEVLGGWRNMAVDPAYDAIRNDPRFRAVSDMLKAADMAARARFRARPDLSEADIDSIGT